MNDEQDTVTRDYNTAVAFFLFNYFSSRGWHVTNEDVLPTKSKYNPIIGCISIPLSLLLINYFNVQYRKWLNLKKYSNSPGVEEPIPLKVLNFDVLFIPEIIWNMNALSFWMPMSWQTEVFITNEKKNYDIDSRFVKEKTWGANLLKYRLIIIIIIDLKC